MVEKIMESKIVYGLAAVWCFLTDDHGWGFGILQGTLMLIAAGGIWIGIAVAIMAATGRL